MLAAPERFSFRSCMWGGEAMGYELGRHVESALRATPEGISEPSSRDFRNAEADQPADCDTVLDTTANGAFPRCASTSA